MGNGTTAKRRQVTIQLDAELSERVQALRDASPVPPTESALLRAAIRAGLPRLESLASEAKPLGLNDAQKT